MDDVSYNNRGGADDDTDIQENLHKHKWKRTNRTRHYTRAVRAARNMHAVSSSRLLPATNFAGSRIFKTSTYLINLEELERNEGADHVVGQA